jgi:hypothetical protein
VLIVADSIMEFILAWRSAEYAALVSQYTATDESVYSARLTELRVFYADSLLPDVHRPATVDARWFEAGAQVVKNLLMERALFQYKRYRQIEYGELVRVYVSHTTRSRDGSLDYFANIFIANQGGGNKILSLYHLNDEVEQLAPDLSGWEYRGGREISDLGTLSATHKIQPPHSARDLHEYNAE